MVFGRDILPTGKLLGDQKKLIDKITKIKRYNRKPHTYIVREKLIVRNKKNHNKNKIANVTHIEYVRNYLCEIKTKIKIEIKIKTKKMRSR